MTSESSEEEMPAVDMSELPPRMEETIEEGEEIERPTKKKGKRKDMTDPKPTPTKWKKKADDGGEDGGRKKKRNYEKKKDPDAPKRALSAFVRFQLEERKKMKADPTRASLTFGEVGKSTGEKWRNMLSSEKAPYAAAAKVDQERYRKVMAGYKSGNAGPAEPYDVERFEDETYFDNVIWCK